MKRTVWGRGTALLAVVALALGACSATPAASSGGASAPSTSAGASASSGASPSGGSPASSGGPIRIGGGFALTGDESALDLPAANGAKLAVKEINAAGGVIGRQLDLIIHDSQYKMDVTAQTAKQFVEQDKVPLFIGYTDTDSVLASGPVMQSNKIPFITVGATSPKIPTQVGDMMFLACFGDNVQAAAGAEYSFKKFGKNAYFMWDKGVEYTTLLGQYFKSRFKELGGNIVLEDSYEDKATDFSAQIAKIVGGDGYDTPDLVKVAGAAADNVFFTTHALMDATGGTDPIKKFIAAYNKEYGHDPENAFAALGYDTVYLLADAIKRANGTDSAAIKKALEETKGFQGITGSVTFSGGAHVPQKGVTVIAITGGKLTLGAEVVPEKVPAP
jgi:branched-chain amino acid transport system substrate-binding protein